MGIHKFVYRELKSEINIFVMKVQDKEGGVRGMGKKGGGRNH